MTSQIVEIAGSQMVLLSREEFDRLSEAAEHYSDIVAAVEAQRRREGGEEYIPQDVVNRLVAGENPLKVWRKFRGFTQQELADKVGHQDAYISKLEKGRAEGPVELWQKLARVLNVELDDLLTPLD
jgi:ribosome-binding protein aMBF1 (putative translation factor)